MPRGVYDRSKTKEQRAAEKGGGAKKAAKAVKAAAASAPKRKYTKKATAVAHDSMLKEAAPVQGGIGMALLRDNSYFAMQEVRANLSTLTVVADKFSDLPSIKTEIEAHVTLLGTLREKVFAEPAQETHDEPAQEVEHETEEEQEAPLAAVSQAAPYQGSVPLPPPIVPVPAPVSH